MHGSVDGLPGVGVPVPRVSHVVASTFSSPVGFIFIFNLIVGTGALTLPAAFEKAGWLLALVTLSALGLTAFVTVTFVIECMSLANFALHKAAIERSGSVDRSFSGSIQRRRHPSVRNGRSSSPDVTQSTSDVTTESPLPPDAHGAETFETASADGLDDVIGADDDDEKQPLLLDDTQPGGPAGRSRQLPPRYRSSDVRPPLGGSTANDNSTAVAADIGSTSSGQYYGAYNEGRQWAITGRVELGDMARMFLPPVPLVVFYVALIVYLYGDLAIYAAAVPKSLRDVVCAPVTNSTNGSSPCTSHTSLSRDTVYRLFVCLFTLLVGPFAFFNVQKTRLLQLVTTLSRWLAFGMMLVLTLMKVSSLSSASSPASAAPHPRPVVLDGFPTVFGAAVYSFMCHHSLPSLVTPIRDKRHLNRLLCLDYIVIAAFYVLLSLPAVFAYKDIQPLYTLQFTDQLTGQHIPPVCTYFLALFPVFTLSASFPIIAVTLRGNIIALARIIATYLPRRNYVTLNGTTSTTSVLSASGNGGGGGLLTNGANGGGVAWQRVGAPLAALLPPIAIALITSDLDALVGITGSYAGAFVQYLVPAALVWYARRRLRRQLVLDGRCRGEQEASTLLCRSPHRSVFSAACWPWLIGAWGVVAISVVTANHVMAWTGHAGREHSPTGHGAKVFPQT